jgi:hypothetical protein
MPQAMLGEFKQLLRSHPALLLRSQQGNDGAMRFLGNLTNGSLPVNQSQERPLRKWQRRQAVTKRWKALSIAAQKPR